MSHPPALEVSVTEVDAMRKAGDDFILLDVREKDEYDATRIEGSRLIPMSVLGRRLDELQSHKDDHIVVHCHHGGRSLQVTHALREAGFSNVQNMAGGIDAWSLEIDPSVPRY
ncbi:rhodanese-like domain-containing protein [Neorhodopirellula pilleata]|uniref:Putative adenylyltransferase/sulfurtransferase MoeZ n=1 Tax=Neorhodopirellula pilleata TaxID=2714738 RepID=A0A5C6A8E0_9BACT|nr:rhodanese-like domain-containing protein [Neorhodopirellula pilleata]TWT95657.1 putative adenylyltransferase/sulfurtransferase MoeZ [Neorhodopirellula pilleata]